MEASTAKQRSLKVEAIRPAYEQVAIQIRDAILEGRLGPGEQLPVELELTRMFGVSRSTVREALRTLASQHLVTTTRGVTGGTYVAHPDPKKVTRYLETSIGLLSDVDEVTVTELTEIRRVLEVPAAARAAESSTVELLSALQERLNGSTRKVESERFEGNRAFHRLLLEAAGNRLITLIAEPVFSVLRTRFARQQAEPSFWTAVHRDHEAILKAVGAGSGDEAAQVMDAHLTRVADTYLKIDRADLE